MNAGPLVQPLFDGPLDVIADVHGEFDALRCLLRHLGYRNDGVHTEGRRLVFLGDLTDRGPNSPAVVSLVARLMARGLAQCILGNHELNILLGERKRGNGWFFGEREALDRSGRVVPQALADERLRARTRKLFLRLPLVLEREDLRIVHACWHREMIDRVRGETDFLAVYYRERQRIDEDLSRLADQQDEVGSALARQNLNPIKVLTSGLEQRCEPFYASGKMRREGRVPWWDGYRDEAYVVFGHYSRARLPGDSAGDLRFDDSRPYAGPGNGRAFCIDYGVARRWRERFDHGPPFRTALAALRWPEKWLYFDTGRAVPVV